MLHKNKSLLLNKTEVLDHNTLNTIFSGIFKLCQSKRFIFANTPSIVTFLFDVWEVPDAGRFRTLAWATPAGALGAAPMSAVHDPIQHCLAKRAHPGRLVHSTCLFKVLMVQN